jgi:hypothetical protein
MRSTVRGGYRWASSSSYKQFGAEYITEKIDEFDEEVKSMRRAAIAAAEADSSEEEN